MTKDITNSNTDSEKLLGTGRKCPECNYIFHGEYDKNGWWCPNCENVRDNKI
jgi:rubrerythrin